MADTFGQRFASPLNAALSQSGSNVRSNSNDPEAIKEINYKAFVVCHDENIVVDAWLPEQVQTDVTAEYTAPFAQGMENDSGLSKLAKLSGISLTTQALTTQVWQGGSYIQFTLPFIFQAETDSTKDVMVPIKNLLRLMMPKEPEPGGLLQAPGPRLDPNKILTTENVKAIGGGALSAGSGVIGQAFDTSNALLGKMLNTSDNVTINGQSTVNELNKFFKPLSNAIVNAVVNNISLYIGQFMYFPSVVVKDVSPTYDVIIDVNKNPVRATVNVTFQTFYIPTQNDIDTMFPSTTASSPQTASGNGFAGPSAAPNNSAAARG